MERERKKRGRVKKEGRGRKEGRETRGENRERESVTVGIQYHHDNESITAFCTMELCS